MYSRILIATDLSPASHAVVRCAAGLKAFGTRECLLLECSGMSKSAVPGVGLAIKELEKGLAEEKAMLEEAGIQVSVEVVTGTPHVEINRLAVEKNCSLVVVGSQSRTLLGEIMLGGAACGVMHHCVKPMLVIRIDSADGGQVACTCPNAFLGHVFYTTDFSENARHALGTLKHLVKCGAGKVTLCHVQDKAHIDPHLMNKLDEFNAIDSERLAKIKQALVEVGATDVELLIRLGHPKAVIMEEAMRQGATLILMGTQGRGFVAEACLGSVSHYVARCSTVPVMLVPQGQPS